MRIDSERAKAGDFAEQGLVESTAGKVAEFVAEPIAEPVAAKLGRIDTRELEPGTAEGLAAVAVGRIIEGRVAASTTERIGRGTVAGMPEVRPSRNSIIEKN